MSSVSEENIELEGVPSQFDDNNEQSKKAQAEKILTRNSAQTIFPEYFSQQHSNLKKADSQLLEGLQDKICRDMLKSLSFAHVEWLAKEYG